MKRHNRIALGVIGVLCLLTTPQFLSAVHTNILVELAISATFAVSVNLLLSYAGLLSFGHALFFGSGAYATALALTHIEGLGPITALLLGGLAGFLVAALCSPFLGRISGTAFAMLSLALGQLMYVMCLKYREVTGGEDGIAGFPIPPLVVPGILRVELTNPTNFFYFALIVLGTSIGLMWHLTRTPFGSLVVGIGNNAERVSYLGFHVSYTKAVLVMISGTFAGVAGSVFALFHNVVSTDGVLHLMVSFFPLMAILVGGIGTFAGPILGSGILILVEDWSSRYTEHVELVTGLIFVVVVLFLPSGLGGLAKILRRRSLTASPE